MASQVFLEERRRGHRDTKGRRPCKDRGRDWSAVTTCTEQAAESARGKEQFSPETL